MKRKRINLFLILSIFLLFNTTLFADSNAQAFKRLFEEAAQGSNGIIRQLVDALYGGLILIFRGISTRVSRFAGTFLIILATLDALKIILMSMGKIDVAGIMKRILPNLIKNLILFSFLVVPIPYNSSLIMASRERVIGTPFSALVETMFGSFMKLGLRFFGSGVSTNLTPGQIAEMFMLSPLQMLQNVFNIMTVLAVFTNIIKIVLLICCLWLASKILATFVANIFSGLIISIFSVLYLIFYMYEGTKEIGNKGVQNIIIQVITVFMTIAMTGVCYQVMDLVSNTSSSITGILSLGLLLLMLQQTTENIVTLARSITQGGGLGGSTNAQFTGMLKAFTGIIAGGAVATAEAVDGARLNYEAGKDIAQEAGKDKAGQVAEGIKSVFSGSFAGRVIQDGKDVVQSKAELKKLENDLVARGFTRSQARAALKQQKISSDNVIKARKMARRAEANSRKKGTTTGTIGMLMGGATSLVTGDLSSIARLTGNVSERMKEREKSAQTAIEAKELAKKHEILAERQTDILKQLSNSNLSTQEKEKLKNEFDNNAKVANLQKEKLNSMLNETSAWKNVGLKNVEEVWEQLNTFNLSGAGRVFADGSKDFSGSSKEVQYHDFNKKVGVNSQLDNFEKLNEHIEKNTVQNQNSTFNGEVKNPNTTFGGETYDNRAEIRNNRPETLFNTTNTTTSDYRTETRNNNPETLYTTNNPKTEINTSNYDYRAETRTNVPETNNNTNPIFEKSKAEKEIESQRTNFNASRTGNDKNDSNDEA